MKVKLNIRLVFLFILSTNFFFSLKLFPHNKVNGGCQTHCSLNESKFIYTNINKYNNTRFEYYKNTNSCVNKNLCRG